VKRTLTLIAVAGLLATSLPLEAGAQIPPTPPRDDWYAQNDAQNNKGHWSDGTRVRIDESCLSLPESEQVACSLDAFKKKPFTVIAFVDSGINPYHADFRAPDFVHHPSKFIEGYPATAEEVPLSLDVADSEGYAAARALDDEEVLSSLAGNRLYWFPGTRIIGGYSGAAGGGGAYPDRKVIDENSHGTGVASVAAGQYFGANPNALIVMVEGLGDASLNWATSQSWIDIVSNSWGNIGNVPLGTTTATRNATRRGQTVAFAAGNGTTNTNSHRVCVPATTACTPPIWRDSGGPSPIDDPCKCKTPDSNSSMTTPYGGASWILTVGATSPINGQAHWWHAVPVDVSSFGSKWRAAAYDGVQLAQNRDFGGTSCATPITSGVLSAVIDRAREVFGDTVGGQRPGQVVAAASPGATLPASGPLADGVLTRSEAEAIVVKTTTHVPFDPVEATWDYAIRPTTGTPYDFAVQGYGVVDRDSKARALKVLVGEAPMPVRADVDQVVAAFDTLRNAVWGNP
jgi:hypothetical protein